MKEQSGWSEVDFVYDPLNYKQHWIMLVIDVNVSRILLYDLLPSYITSRDLIQFLLPLCYTLHSLVDFCNLQASKLDLQPPPWRLSCINCGKLQGSGTLDCGIFCLKFFEYLVTGAGRESLQQSRMLEFRLQYSAELWADQFFVLGLSMYIMYILYSNILYFVYLYTFLYICIYYVLIYEVVYNQLCL